QKRVTDDEQRPPIAHLLQAGGHGARHAGEALSSHGPNRSKVSCNMVLRPSIMTQPTMPGGAARMAAATAGPRTLTVSWEDPMALAASGLNVSGLDFLSGFVTGRLPAPPITHLMGFTLVEVETGRAVFAAEPGEQHYNPIGVVHGGLAMTLLDSALGCAVHSTLPAGFRYTTLETK